MSATGAGDSGVETECEVESNDSFMSNFSVSENSNMAAPALPPSVPQHPQVREHQEDTDGYLADCSSDGGNEKNFPLPPDWSSSRVSLPPSPGQSEEELVEPPAGLVFSSLATNSDSPGMAVIFFQSSVIMTNKSSISIT